jgi:hypothetical protein
MSRAAVLIALLVGLYLPLAAQMPYRIHVLAIAGADHFNTPGIAGFEPKRSTIYGGQISLQWVSNIRVGVVSSFLWQKRSIADNRFYDPAEELRHEVESNGYSDFSILFGPSYHLFAEDKSAQIELRALAGYRSLSLGQYTERFVSVTSYKWKQLTYEFDQQGGWIFMPSILFEGRPKDAPIGFFCQVSSWWSSSRQELEVRSGNEEQRIENFRLKSSGLAISAGLVFAF